MLNSSSCSCFRNAAAASTVSIKAVQADASTAVRLSRNVLASAKAAPLKSYHRYYKEDEVAPVRYSCPEKRFLFCRRDSCEGGVGHTDPWTLVSQGIQPVAYREHCGAFYRDIGSMRKQY